MARVDYFRFGLVFTQKYNQTGKKTRNRTETGLNRLVSVWFFIQKTVKTYMHFFGFISTMSPRKNWSFSILAGCIAITELSSLITSSTTRRLTDFFRSKITVEKSFLPLFLLLFTYKQVWLSHSEDTKSKPSNQKLNEYIVQWIHSRFFQNTVKANNLIRINQISNNNHSSKNKKPHILLKLGVFQFTYKQSNNYIISKRKR